MKNMKQLISFVKNLPSFKNFQKNIYFDMLKKSLPNIMKKSLCFTYVKNTTLFFVFDNPYIATEFEHKKNFIKSIIKTIEKMHKINLNISELRAISPISMHNKRLGKVDSKTEKKIFFKEKSFGEYSNSLKDKELFNKLENIRKIIKDKHL